MSTASAPQRPGSLKKRIFFRLLAVLLGFGAPLLLAEIVLRFLPVYSGMKLMPLNEANPVPRFTPNQSIVWSKGWGFYLVNRFRINNDGFVNEQDYDASARSPLFAVIGDSYIEAAMVPCAQTVQGRLQTAVGQRGRVYSFGKSGAPLSMYLVWADHARATYKPDALMISVVGNDFDESLNKYKTMVAGYYYIENDKGELELKRFNYEPTMLRKLARQSALFRYLTWNVELEAVLLSLTGHKDEYVGNTRAKRSEKTIEESKRAVDAFFRDLPSKSGLPPNRIVFTVDGIRPQLYDAKELEKVKDSFVAVLRQYFMEQARAKGCEVIDLQPLFIADYAKRQKRFEYPQDYHWNETGHEVVAEAVKQSKVFKSVFGE